MDELAQFVEAMATAFESCVQELRADIGDLGAIDTGEQEPECGCPVCGRRLEARE